MMIVERLLGAVPKIAVLIRGFIGRCRCRRPFIRGHMNGSQMAFVGLLQSAQVDVPLRGVVFSPVGLIGARQPLIHAPDVVEVR
jgi:hypothetical protein